VLLLLGRGGTGGATEREGRFQEQNDASSTYHASLTQFEYDGERFLGPVENEKGVGKGEVKKRERRTCPPQGEDSFFRICGVRTTRNDRRHAFAGFSD